MSEFKIAGACTTCDAMCYEVMARNAEHERRPGEPKRLGKPNDDATLVHFLLFDGTKTSLTFCGACATALNPEQYTPIWRKVMRSWMREQEGQHDEHAAWFVPQFQNGLLAELGRIKVKDLNHG